MMPVLRPVVRTSRESSVDILFIVLRVFLFDYDFLAVYDVDSLFLPGSTAA